jgi:hypothetical protein
MRGRVIAALLAMGCATSRPKPDTDTQPPPPSLPSAIHLKSATRSFNSYFYYALVDGELWFKSIPSVKEAEGVAPQWKRMAQPKVRFASISADQDEVMAVSDAHRHYSMRWFENPVFKEETPPQVWTDKHGWPVSGALVWNARVAQNRGWAVGRRTRNVAVFEDPLGRSFDGGGGLSTYYFLARDGAAIAFTDSGLPPDFSHTLCGPDRSTFIAESLQVAADTLFVINAYGEMRTRLADFDTSGSDTMFFHYTYDRAKPPADAIALPGEDWLAHAGMPLEGQAQISTQIAIALTGKHNRDRELRVAGFDRERRVGYWKKALLDGAWTFAPDPEVSIDSEALLDPNDTDPDPKRAATRTKVPHGSAHPAKRAPLRTISYEGELRSADQRLEARVEVSQFQLECSPATLKLSVGDDAVELTLHTVEKWYHLPRFDPGRDGTPKEFLATLQLSPGAAPKSEALKALLRDVLAPHLRDFGFFAQATEDYLELDSIPGVPKLVISLERPGRHYPSLAAAKHDSLRREDFTLRAMDPALQAADGADLKTLEQKIADNERVAGELTEECERPDRLDRETPEWLSPAVMSTLKLATGPTMIRLILPALPFRNVPPEEASYYGQNLTTNLPPLLARSREVKDLLQRYARRDLEHAQMLLRTRIDAYRARLNGGARRAYFEGLSGWWSAFRFGEKSAQGRFLLAGRTAPTCKWTVDDRPIFEPERRVVYGRRPMPPGFFITAKCGETATLLFRVSPTQLEADAFKAGGTLALETPVVAQLEWAELTARDEKIAWIVPGSGRDPWDNELPGTLSVKGGQLRLTTKAVTLDWSR